MVLAGWLNERQRYAVEYLREENRVLRQQRGRKRLRLTDDQRRRLAAKRHKVGAKTLSEMATIVTLDTILPWHRELIARRSALLAVWSPAVVRVAFEEREGADRRFEAATERDLYEAGGAGVDRIRRRFFPRLL